MRARVFTMVKRNQSGRKANAHTPAKTKSVGKSKKTKQNSSESPKHGFDTNNRRNDSSQKVGANTNERSASTVKRLKLYKKKVYKGILYNK